MMIMMILMIMMMIDNDNDDNDDSIMVIMMLMMVLMIITYLGLLRYLHDRRLLPLWSDPVFQPVHVLRPAGAAALIVVVYNFFIAPLLV